MPIPLSITDLSATPANNSPQGTEPMGTNADDYMRSHAAIIRQIYDAIIAGTVVNLVPVGAVIMSPTGVVFPGWLACEGQAVSRSTFAALYAQWGTSFGVGDGSTTFNLLDMRGVFPRGWDHGKGVDPGRAIGSLQGNQMSTHTHTASENAVGDHAHNYTVGFAGPFVQSQVSGTFTLGGLTTSTTTAAGGHSHTITIAPAGGGLENRPINTSLLFVVKF